MNKVTFPKHTDFRAALLNKVKEYFEDNNLQQRDSAYMYIKALIFVGLLAAAYVALVFYSTNFAFAFLAAVALGTAQWGIGFNIMHDGNHGAFSRHTWVNRLTGFWLDLVGSSSFWWRYRHNFQHHTYTSIVGKDCDVEQQPFARLSTDQPWRSYHRYQHWYMWALYGLVHFGFVFGDFKRIISRKNGIETAPRPKGWELAEFTAGKVIYMTLAFVIPLMIHPWWTVLAFYAFISLYTGVVLGVIGQLGHMVDNVEHPGEVDGMNPVEWTKHQIATTASFAIDSKVSLFLFGGLGCQVIHHLCPEISHVHYPRLTRIMERVCDDYGVRHYSHPTVWSALKSHQRFLRLMGRGIA